MGRSPCCDKNALKKGPWTQEEDTKLIQYIQMHGPGNWKNLPKNAGLERCGKSCRLRWTNYLRPDIKRGRFSFEEEETIIQLHSVLGNKWSAIATRLPGRTDNEIKNYWNTHIRKRLLRTGIDPVTHAPRLDILDLSSLLINSPQLNLSNLLRLQTLLNPEALTLAMSLLSSSSSPPSSQVEDQLLINVSDHQSQQLVPLIQPNQFENIFNPQIPSDITNSSFHNNNNNNYNIYNQSQSLQGDIDNFYGGSTNPNCQIFQDMFIPTTACDHQNLPTDHVVPSVCRMRAELSENSRFQSLNISSSSSSIDNNSQSLGFDSILATPELTSGARPNSGSGFTGGDERDSFCTDDLLRFEIPEGLDFDEFM